MENNITEWLSETSQTKRKSFRESQEGFSIDSHTYSSIPQLLVSGLTLKHSGKEGKQAVVPRYCIVRLTRLGRQFYFHHKKPPFFSFSIFN